MADQEFERGDKVSLDLGEAGQIDEARVIKYKPPLGYVVEIDVGGLGLEGDFHFLKYIDEDLLVPAEESKLKDIKI